MTIEHNGRAGRGAALPDSGGKGVAGNALALGLRVLISAAVSTVTSAIVVRSLDPSTFSTWALVLQIANYAWLADLGVQPAVTRLVAAGDAGLSGPSASSVVSTACAALGVVGAVSFLALVLLSGPLLRLFPEIPSGLLPTARWTLLLVTGALLLTLPGSALQGALVGRGRGHIVAWVSLVPKIATSVAIAAAAARGWSLPALGAASALGTVATVLGVGAFTAMEDRPRRSHVSWQTFRVVSTYARSLTVSGLSIYTIINLDAFVVARVDFERVGAYVAGTGLVTIVGSATWAATTALLPAFTARSGEPLAFWTEVASALRLMTATVLVGLVPLIVGANLLLGTWLGATYAALGGTSLRILLVASIVRLALSPLVQAVLALGRHRLQARVAVIEAVTNVTCSIVLGRRFGAAGVAAGTLVGAVVGHLLLLRTVHSLGSAPVQAAARTAHRAAVAVIALAVVSAPGWMQLTVANRGVVGLTSALGLSVATATIGWRVVLGPGERTRVAGLVARVVGGRRNPR